MLRRIAAGAAIVLAAGVLPAIALSGAEAAPDDSSYRPVAGPDLSGDRVRVRPSHYSAVAVDVAGVRAALRTAPAAGRATYREFRVPTPTGGTERFAVQRTRVMEAKLAAAHPEIGTWAGRSLDNPSTTIALDVTPMGFHASVRGPAGQRAWYVDPAFNERGTTTHLAYYGAAVEKTAAQAFVEKQAPELRRAVPTGKATKAAGKVVKQKVYRLALTSDPSYADYFGTANVLAEKVTLINRVNQIYNDDLAITMQLVNATEDLNLDTEAKATGDNGPCGAHPCFDPADPSDPESFSQLDFCDVPGLGRNRTVLGQLVGASNYDVGHLALGVNGGGIAYLGVVGVDYKGSGCTGLPEPVGDFFAIDYVAHEIGHQFAGQHTFNGVQFACSGGNRVQETSVEPGSGSSVMAYAGICLQDDLQPHTDPYFSQRTIKEVTAYTGANLQQVTEVQTISLRGFDTDGEEIVLSFPGAAGNEILERGDNYDAAGIKAAVENLTGEDVTIAGWGYDPEDSFVSFPATLTDPDDTGFQVIFANTPDYGVYGGAGNVAALEVSSPSAGVSGFVGETAKGGAAENRGRSVTTRNHHPKAKAPKSKTIPLRTPFKLKGAGSDSDGDTLTYLWEQNDEGGDEGTSLVSNKKKNGPLFRVFGTIAKVTASGTQLSPSPNLNLATGSATRYFPDLDQVLSGNTNAATGKCPKVKPLPDDLDNYVTVKPKVVNCYSEFLPINGYRGRAGSNKPAMHFRLTVRDGSPYGGGTDHDDVVLRIDPKAGPFLVTSQKSKGVRVSGRTLGKVTWDVNGTRPLAKKVRILLSTDGGKTWKYTLGGKTANDGSQPIRWPNVKSSKARVMVESVGNYFFAVNNKRFSIR